LIFSGGEPLLRSDLFELAQYATNKGLKAAIGTNGTLITDAIAERLVSSGVRAVAISIDSSRPEGHDAFRRVKGSWVRAIEGIDACRHNGLSVQVNTTVTPQNFEDIGPIITLAERHGAQSFHLFFLVPTGRGTKVTDISAESYEKMIGDVLENVRARSPSLTIRPVCAPQFLRIAAQKGMSLAGWGRGCIAGLSYCRIYPTGEVTPCPYLPLSLGNVRETEFGELWFHSPILQELRDRTNLRGKCARCDYREVCGGCRARAYGLSGAINACGGLYRPEDLQGDYLAEEPGCLYQPGDKL
jgi:radical SAM protein with 4Fe4S-binding SPASM domain